MIELRAVLPIAETLRAVRAAVDTVVVVIVPHDLPAVERAMLIAAIGPLAIERAPAQRVCALDLGAAADPADVAAAVRFLARAASTTGQVLKVA